MDDGVSYGRMPEWKSSEILLRRVMERVCGILPDGAQYRCFARLKRIRNSLGRADAGRLLDSWNHLEAGCPVVPGEAAGAATFSVTHDVDYVDCWRYLPRLLELDARLGIRATYNVLTKARYALDNAVLFAIRDKGHEIGLHGRTHDRALGFRPAAYIRDFVGSAKSDLEGRIGKVLGFRTPALAVSRTVIDVLDEFGFLYDSSLSNSSLCSSFTPQFRPFRIGDRGLVEIPLTVQDSMFINDTPLTQEQIDRMTGCLIGLAQKHGASLVLNFHPVIIGSRPDVYAGIVRLLTGSSLRQCLMRDLVER